MSLYSTVMISVIKLKKNSGNINKLTTKNDDHPKQRILSVSMS